jgi:hypothetical protein
VDSIATRGRARTGHDRGHSVVNAVENATAIIPVSITCLPRALVMDALLRSSGIASVLRIGVASVDGTVTAHAWVEVDGAPVADRSDVAATYAAFDGPITDRIVASMA